MDDVSIFHDNKRFSGFVINKSQKDGKHFSCYYITIFFLNSILLGLIINLGLIPLHDIVFYNEGNLPKPNNVNGIVIKQSRTSFGMNFILNYNVFIYFTVIMQRRDDLSDIIDSFYEEFNDIS